MKPEKLSDLKKILAGLSATELTEICLRLAKYKKENKELLTYLLFDVQEPMKYAEDVKIFLIADFETMQKHYFYSTKSLRKIIRLMNRYAKYTGSKQVEIELAIWFCTNYLIYVDLKTTHKPLQALLNRQIEKIVKLIDKLHEDLQFDYQKEFDVLIINAEKWAKWINKSQYL
ncbi:hypothetical protein [Daejeonella sp.]|jgi:Holliday junction resolvase-like predicted endonuclease|uniref:hypothetical protein n=1 Tax=Daejeonella sp. TaxID=2805397 RepID=UPI0037841386